MPEILNVEFRLDINSGNAAVTEDPRSSVAALLRAAAAAVEGGHDAQRLFDLNGNLVGSWFVDIEEEEEN